MSLIGVSRLFRRWGIRHWLIPSGNYIGPFDQKVKGLGADDITGQ